jgi:hypothetical protein
MMNEGLLSSAQFERIGAAELLSPTPVIASAGEAIHGAAKQNWIASSLTLLAMTELRANLSAAKGIKIMARTLPPMHLQSG